MLLSSNPPHLNAGVLGSPRKMLGRTCHHWSCASRAVRMAHHAHPAKELAPQDQLSGASGVPRLFRFYEARPGYGLSAKGIARRPVNAMIGRQMMESGHGLHDPPPVRFRGACARSRCTSSGCRERSGSSSGNRPRHPGKDHRDRDCTSSWQRRHRNSQNFYANIFLQSRVTWRCILRLLYVQIACLRVSAMNSRASETNQVKPMMTTIELSGACL